MQSDPIGLMAGVNTYSYVDSSPLAWWDVLGLTKGGKRNINTEGFTDKSCPDDIQKALDDAIQKQQPRRVKALRAILKVAKRNVKYIFLYEMFDELVKCSLNPCECEPNGLACLMGPA